MSQEFALILQRKIIVFFKLLIGKCQSDTRRWMRLKVGIMKINAFKFILDGVIICH